MQLSPMLAATLTLQFLLAAQTGALPGVDVSALTPAQQQAVLKILGEQNCSCGCDMKIAECRVKDPNCAYSKALAEVVVRGFAEGKSDREVGDALAAAAAKMVPAKPKLLEDPVQIPIAGSPMRGPADARITLVEFSDFECPYCANASAQVEAVLRAYPKDVKLVYKQFPLESHSHAALAAEAALAAHAQNKFWPLHDRMFANFRSLSRANIIAWAREAGIDTAQLTADLDSGKYKDTVGKDVADGERSGVQGTPSFFINGQRLNGPLELGVLKPIFEGGLKGGAGK